MTVHARVRVAGLAATLALALASCAQVPVHAPAAPPAPPAHAAPSAPAPAPVPRALAAPAVYRLDGEPNFDVGLVTDADSISFLPTDTATMSWREPDGSVRSATVDQALRVRVSGAQAIVEPLARARAVPITLLQAGDTLWVGDESFARGESARLVWGGRHWRGRFKIFIGPRGRLTLATRVPLERYLLGVVPAEIGALRDSLLEAGRAQAIAARSYSLFYRGRRAAEGFDVFGTVEDQVYGPTESERPLATRCVESTRGLVSTYDGAPIRANYYSTCGGITADVVEAWPTEDRPYLHSVADRGNQDADLCALSPQYRWREEWTADQFAAVLERNAPAQKVDLPAAGVGEIRDVNVDQRSHSGRVWRLRVSTSTGEIVIPAYSVRQVLRRPGSTGAILRSNLFKVGVRRDASGRVLEVVASGAGSGHGVGLCQTGALAMARGGARAADILAHYYASTEIRKLY
jgi:stage II sporulation protein D